MDYKVSIKGDLKINGVDAEEMLDVIYSALPLGVREYINDGIFLKIVTEEALLGWKKEMPAKTEEVCNFVEIHLIDETVTPNRRAFFRLWEFDKLADVKEQVKYRIKDGLNWQEVSDKGSYLDRRFDKFVTSESVNN